MRPLVVLALLATLIVAPCTAARSTTAATPPAARSGDFVGLVDIGGRSLYLECRGAGSPTVILEAGFRTRADVWSDDVVQPEAPRTMVFPGIARFTRVCAYDRPGSTFFTDGTLLTSRSDPAPMPRAAQAAVDDLDALLEAAAIPGPYVLVGHSFGGLFMRLFAAEHPHDVAGLVLVDAFPEAMKDAMTPAQWQAYDGIFQPVPPELAGYRDLEFTALDTSVEQMRAAADAQPLPPSLPMVVLSRGQAMTMPSHLPGGLTGEMLERAWQSGQDMLAALVPGARHVIASESEHYIQLQQPELVITAVHDVVAAVRDPGAWASAATPSP